MRNQYVNSRRSLTHDETIELQIRGEDQQYRVRLWQCNDASAVALVSQIDPGFVGMPSLESARIANFINEVMLKFSDRGFTMFICEEAGSTYTPDRRPMGDLMMVVFGTYGHHSRLRFFEPYEEQTTQHFIESFVGPIVL